MYKEMLTLTVYIFQNKDSVSLCCKENFRCPKILSLRFSIIQRPSAFLVLFYVQLSPFIRFRSAGNSSWKSQTLLITLCLSVLLSLFYFQMQMQCSRCTPLSMFSHQIYTKVHLYEMIPYAIRYHNNELQLHNYGHNEFQ